MKTQLSALHLVKMDEEWRDITIPEVKGRYKVSNLGNVLSILTKRNLKPARRGLYLSVCLNNEKEHNYKVSHTVHSLVAREFLGYVPGEGVLISHLDGNHDNNCVDNLELASKSVCMTRARAREQEKPVVRREKVEIDTTQAKVLDEYPGYYIFPDGKIWSKRSKIFIKPRLDGNGYHLITLGKTSTLVHRVVANAWLPPPKDGQDCINHINMDKRDNRVENLEWCTHSENMLERYRNSDDVLIKKPVAQYTLDGDLVKTYDTIGDAAKETDLDKACIIRCCTGKYKTSGGFKWKFYLEDSVEEQPGSLTSQHSVETSSGDQGKPDQSAVEQLTSAIVKLKIRKRV